MDMPACPLGSLPAEIKSYFTLAFFWLFIYDEFEKTYGISYLLSLSHFIFSNSLLKRALVFYAL